MTFLKSVSTLFDEFFKNHAFTRKGAIYYRFKGEILQAIAFKTRFREIRAEVVCSPYWCTELYPYLMKGDNWVHANHVINIHRSFDYDNFNHSDELKLIFDVFRSEFYALIDKVNDFNSYWDFHNEVKDIRSSQNGTDVWGCCQVTIIEKLYRSYIDSKSWFDLKPEYEDILVQYINNFKKTFQEYKNNFAESFNYLSQKDLENLIQYTKPNFFKDYEEFLAYPCANMPTSKYAMIKTFISIIETEDLSHIAEFVNLERKAEYTLGVLRSYFKKSF